MGEWVPGHRRWRGSNRTPTHVGGTATVGTARGGCCLPLSGAVDGPASDYCAAGGASATGVSSPLVRLARSLVAWKRTWKGPLPV